MWLRGRDYTQKSPRAWPNRYTYMQTRTRWDEWILQLIGAKILQVLHQQIHRKAHFCIKLTTLSAYLYFFLILFIYFLYRNDVYCSNENVPAKSEGLSQVLLSLVYFQNEQYASKHN
jgi:hypothetical protein